MGQLDKALSGLLQAFWTLQSIDPTQMEMFSVDFSG